MVVIIKYVNEQNVIWEKSSPRLMKREEYESRMVKPRIDKSRSSGARALF